MSRASRISQQVAQEIRNEEISDPLASAPRLPKGQMPIEEVFKMMWARMNFLENALKERSILNKEGTLEEENSTNIKDLNPSPVNQIIQQSHNLSNDILNEIKKTLSEHSSKIQTLAQEVDSLKKTLGETIGNFNQSIQMIGGDMTEMNNKYTQMNNFLMEIQTTQITVNNQILKHYNDNYSDLIETQITQSADEKFNLKETTVSEEVENQEIVNTPLKESDVEEDLNREEISTATEHNQPSEETPKKKNNVTFNIE